MTLSNGFEELKQNEMQEVDGGIAPAVVAAYLALLGTGFTAGVTIGIHKWF
ncbi:MAG TPA: class IIb bacteriocin, lactobin A/cerein 7B family [Candidatus Mediterraneibacter intestinipullorum]|nr:class IIb bacteriocin, lactobin A/cerein 7B family [Candidatus Mediterraneibacter intestinipullorum]